MRWRQFVVTGSSAVAGWRHGGLDAVTLSMRAGSTPYPEVSALDRNFLLATALSLAVFSAWLAWQAHVHPPVVPGEGRAVAVENATRHAGEGKAGETDRAAPAQRVEPAGRRADSTTRKAVVEEQSERGRASAPPIAKAPDDTPAAPIWRGALENELVGVEFTNRGGALSGWRLLHYFETPEEKIPVELIDLPDEHSAAWATPFSELGLGDLSKATYSVEKMDANSVVFELKRSGISIRKIYRLSPDSFDLDLEIEIENASKRAVSPSFELIWPVGVSSRQDFKQVSVSALVDGKVKREQIVSVGRPGLFSKLLGRDDKGPSEYKENVLWAGMDLRYFVAVLIPKPEQGRPPPRVVFEPIVEGKLAAAVLSEEGRAIEPGQTVVHGYTGFLGPKHHDLLAEAGWNLERTINSGYSWVAPLTTFFGWALHATHRIVPNYGLAIILITLLVRLATWPVMAKQMKSSERMRELMPRVKEIQSRYKDDRQRQSEETFKLYRETGVNPLGGCLPMFLQLPVFIGLFYALQSSIDLRHAPFMLWVNDLSAPATAFTLPGVDFPVRILPIIMAVSMLAQQKMMPQAGTDPTQQKMMLIMMPGMMGVISYSFPSGLVLYWMVSNLLGIGHQLLVRRRMQREAEAAAAS